MKRSIISVVLFFFLYPSINSYSQQWPVEIIRSNLVGAWILPGDFDNDNDSDLLIQNGDTLFWYENLQPGWAEHLIDTQFLNSTYSSLEIFDLDRDGDLDILQFPFVNPSTIAWNENQTNGMQWQKHIISNTVNKPGNIKNSYGDLDGDNDIDFTVPSWGDGSILWFENVFGDTTWEEHLVANIGSNAIWTTLTDIDGDNDLDIVGATYSSGEIFWYENQLPYTTWVAHQIVTLPATLPESTFGVSADMDSDGDQDIITHSNSNNILIWFENPSWSAHFITSGITNLNLGPVGDVDLDGDPDVFFSGQNEFGWCENLGNGQDWRRYVIDTVTNSYPSSTDLADINFDGYPDLTANTMDISNLTGDTRWYANPYFRPTLKRVPQQFTTIQAGIDAAIAGDTVLVAENRYYENINFKGKAITVASLFIMDGDTNHINNTIIDGSQPSHPDSGSVVYFNSGEDTTSVLCGFTITGGIGTKIFILPTVRIPVGGGIFIYGVAGGKICNNRIINNTVSNGSLGGGMYAGPENNSAFVIIENNLFESNACLNGYRSQGGGASIGMNARICNNTFQNNVATCTVNGEAWGGGFSSWAADTVLVLGNTIKGNRVQAFAGTGALGGGFIFFMDSPSFIRMTGNVIANNELISSCGSGGAGGTIENTAGDVLFANNLVYDNYYSGASSCHGTGLSIHDSSLISIINNTITGNEASIYGGALCIWDTTTTATALAMNNIIWGNSVGSYLPEIHIVAGGKIPDIVYCDVQGGWTGEGNIDDTPQFVMGDSLFHLIPNTLNPCVNSGTDSVQIDGHWYYCPPNDYEGDVRPFPGTRPDMGADETDVIDAIELQPITGIPKSYSLEQNYPNPFNPTTTIEFSIPKTEFVTLKIYNLLGQAVSVLVSEKLAAGKYKYIWDASSFASAIYLYKIEAGDYLEFRKMLLIR